MSDISVSNGVQAVSFPSDSFWSPSDGILPSLMDVSDHLQDKDDVYVNMVKDASEYRMYVEGANQSYCLSVRALAQKRIAELAEAPDRRITGFDDSNTARHRAKQLPSAGVIDQVAKDYASKGKRLTNAALRRAGNDEKVSNRRSELLEIGEKYGEQVLPNVQIVEGDFFNTSVIKDKSIDLIYTEPPYDVQDYSQYGRMAEWAVSKLKDDGLVMCYAGIGFISWIIKDMSQYLEYFYSTVIWMPDSIAYNWRVGFRTKYKPILCWRKKGSTRGLNGIRDVEMCRSSDRTIHKWEHDVQAPDYYVNNLCSPGSLICDPFLGEGIFAFACPRDMNFIGCEIDENVCTVARGLVATEYDNFQGVN